MGPDTEDRREGHNRTPIRRLDLLRAVALHVLVGLHVEIPGYRVGVHGPSLVDGIPRLVSGSRRFCANAKRTHER